MVVKFTTLRYVLVKTVRFLGTAREKEKALAIVDLEVATTNGLADISQTSLQA